MNSESNYQGLIERLQLHASLRPDETAFNFLSNGDLVTDTLSFLELNRQVETIATELCLRDLVGRPVGLIFQAGLDFIVAFLACLRAGVVAVPLPTPKRPADAARTLRLAAAAGVVRLFADQACLAHLPSPIGAAGAVAEPWPFAGKLATKLSSALALPAPGDTAFLQFTSGSTGRPKGVTISHANIAANQAAIQAAFGHGRDTVVVGWLPHYHDMGLVGQILQPLYLGARCVLMPPDAFLQRPVRWLRAVARHGGTTSGAPNFAYQLCANRVEPNSLGDDIDLSAWQVAFCGAEPVRADTLRAFASRFASRGFRSNAFLPCYGMAENTVFITGRPQRSATFTVAALCPDTLSRGWARSAPGPVSREVVNCGRPAVSDQIWVVDPEHLRPLPEGQVGEIVVAGPSVMQGYWQDPQASAEVLLDRLDGQPGRFLRTGDLGFLHDGELHVTGRRKALIIVNGVNFHAHDIEHASREAHPACRPGAAAFQTVGHEKERVVLVQEVYPHLLSRLDREALKRQIRSAVLAAHGLVLDEVCLTPRRLALTSSGKIRRGEVRQAWADGIFTGATSATSNHGQLI